MLWARPERTFCTRAHRVAASHCRPRRVPPLALARLQSHALPSPTRQNPPSHPWRPTAPPSGLPWRHAGVGSGLLPWTAPPKPPARASCPLEQPELIHMLVGTRSSPPRRPAATATATRRRSYPPPRSQPRRAIKGGPELLRALRQPQATPIVLPQPAIDGEGPSSSSPASSAAAELRCNTSQPGPPPPIQRHQESPHSLAELPSDSASTKDHHSPKLTLLPNLRPPRSSPPVTSSVPTCLAPTGRTAPAWRIHPCPRDPVGSCRSPTAIAGAPPRSGREKGGRGRTVKPDQWAPWTHCQ